MDSIRTILTILAIVFASVFGLAIVIFLIGKVFGLTFLVLRNIFRFIGQEVTDTLRLVGAILASVLFAPLVVLSVIIGRWSASKHYAHSLIDEIHGALRCVYRLFIGNPARLLGLNKALEGVEQRVPNAMAGAPTRDKPSKRQGVFEGYTIVGSLKSGGSGSKLYIATPDPIKQAVFSKRKLGEIDQVVIKVFSLTDGSSLPQIVRESRALDSARQLGLVLEHQMTPDRFYYVMRFVPGESLSQVTHRLHALSSVEGLDRDHLQSAMGYGEDLLVALDTYHHAELWHKDVKPDNIIVDGHGKDAKAHLVDFGLVTPMRSAMTLTTHGTEYFRDPELVRQALRGVKVHQIDGSKFDVYAAGAVLFSMIENSFPAHGGLSQITKRCPDALRWIVRRAMAEYDRRYPSAAAMLADLRVVINAKDPFAIKPIDLPSVSQGDIAAAAKVESQAAAYQGSFDAPSFGQVAHAASPLPPVPPVPPMHAASIGGRVGRPNTKVTDWWSGKYSVVGAPVQPHSGKAKSKKNKKKSKHFVVQAGIGANGPFAKIDRDQIEDQSPSVGHARRVRNPEDRKPAADQVRAARKRAQDMRNRASSRVNANMKSRSSYSNTPGVAVVFASLLGLAVLAVGAVVGTAMFTSAFHSNDSSTVATIPAPPEAPFAHNSIVIDHNGIKVNDHVLVSTNDHEHEHNHPVVDHAQVRADVLLVSKLTPPVDPDVLHAVQAEIESLREHGMTIFGDMVADIDDDFAIDQTAKLQNAIGSVPMDSAQFTVSVQRWIESEPIDGVMFLTSNPGSADELSVLLVMKEFHTSLPLSQNTVSHLLNVMRGNGYTPD